MSSALVLVLLAQVAHYRPLAGATLPDSTITPGELRPGATVAQLCTMSTRQFRQVTRAQRDSVYQLYGARRGCCQADHFVPLGLGGSNSVRNLWPQPLTEAARKDQLEFWLYTQVCARVLKLEAAQRAIRTNWYATFLLWQAGGLDAIPRCPQPQGN